MQKNKFGYTLQGIMFALSIKKDHLNHYAGACIQSWSEISNTADLQHVNFQMGRLASYTNRFCISVSNLPFCKELMYQYMLLSIMKSSVIMGTIAIVHESKYPNHEYKVTQPNRPLFLFKSIWTHPQECQEYQKNQKDTRINTLMCFCTNIQPKY